MGLEDDALQTIQSGDVKLGMPQPCVGIPHPIRPSPTEQMRHGRYAPTTWITLSDPGMRVQVPPHPVSMTNANSRWRPDFWRCQGSWMGLVGFELRIFNFYFLTRRFPINSCEYSFPQRVNLRCSYGRRLRSAASNC